MTKLAAPTKKQPHNPPRQADCPPRSHLDGTEGNFFRLMVAAAGITRDPGSCCQEQPAADRAGAGSAAEAAMTIAANGVNCAHGEAPGGIDRDGNVESCIYVGGGPAPVSYFRPDYSALVFVLVAIFVLSFLIIMGGIGGRRHG